MVQRGRVLCVDPSGQRRDRTAETLRAEGLSVTGRATVPEGVAAFDCVVIEHDPPDLDAAAALDAVRETDRLVPVIVIAATDGPFLTAVADDEFASYLPRTEKSVAELLPARVGDAAGSRSKVADLFDLVDEAVAVFDVDSRRILTANDAFTERWSLDDGETRLDDLLVEALSEGGEPETLIADATSSWDRVATWHCSDEEGNLFKTSVRVRVEPDGSRGYLVADVPDTRDAETYERRGMLKTLLEHVPLSVYFKDLNGRHVAASEAITTLNGPPYIENPEGKRHHTAADLIGKTDGDLYPPRLAERTIADDRRVIETGKPIRTQIEQPFDDPLGGTYVSTSKAPWYDSDGTLRGLLGVTTDVTQRMQYEVQLERQNERLDEFADAVSHDLRNPLHVAQGRLELFRETGDDTDLEVVEEMNTRMENLIDDVLTFAREGIRVVDPEPADLSAVAETAWDGVDTTGATLAQNWEYTQVEADDTRVRRLFENLFRNAVEHGGESVAVEVGTTDSVYGFYVQDDGPGIPADRREEVFDRGVTTDPEGTGFGLRIVKEIAEAHGWRVRLLESEHGGARFEFVGINPV